MSNFFKAFCMVQVIFVQSSWLKQCSSIGVIKSYFRANDACRTEIAHWISDLILLKIFADNGNVTLFLPLER